MNRILFLFLEKQNYLRKYLVQILHVPYDNVRFDFKIKHQLSAKLRGTSIVSYEDICVALRRCWYFENSILRIQKKQKIIYISKVYINNQSVTHSSYTLQLLVLILFMK